MPIYEYECEACCKCFEEMQSITDKPLKKCRFCGGKVSRLISQTSFSLKGGGWYKDGYSSGKSGQEKKSSSESQPKPEKSAAKPS